MYPPTESWLIKNSNIMNSDAQSAYNWSTAGGTATRVDGIAPIGRACSFVEDGTLGQHGFFSNVSGIFEPNGTITTKYFVKAVNRDKISVVLISNSGIIITLQFNLTDLSFYGSTGTGGGVGISPEGTFPFIYEGLDGWVLIGVTADGRFMEMGSGISNALYIIALDDSYNLSYTGENTEAFLIWKGMIHKGALPHPFFQNDYDDTGGIIYQYPTEAVQLCFDGAINKRDNLQRAKTSSYSGLTIDKVYSSKKYFRLTLSNIPLNDALMLNRWWKNKDKLVYFNGCTHEQYEVFLVGKKAPMNKYDKIYPNELHGSVELEVVREVFPY